MDMQIQKLFQKKKFSQGDKVTLSLEGLHCVSCCLNIDETLEALDGVHSSSTSYAKSMTVVTHDPDVVSKDVLIEKIKGLGYSAVIDGTHT